MAAIDEVLQLVSRRQPLTLLQQDEYLKWLKNQENAAQKITELEEKARLIDGVVGSIVPKGQTSVTKVSQISNDLGDMVAGRFLSPAPTATSTEPTNAGFTGSFMSGAGESFVGDTWNIGGVNAGVLQFGLSQTDGKAYFAGGAAIIDADGISLPQGDISTPIADSSSLKWKNENDDITTYIQDAKVNASSNSLIWSHRRLNAGGSVLSYIQHQEYAYDSGRANYALLINGRTYFYFNDDTQKDLIFNYSNDDINFRVNNDLGTAIYTDGAGAFVYVNPDQLDTDFIVYGDTAVVLTVDAGLDAIGIGGAAESGYKLKVTGDVKVTGSITGGITPISSTVDIWRVDNISDNDFTGTIATLPGGSTLTYTITGGTNEDGIVPQAATQLGKVVLHNTTRGDTALIDSGTLATNTLVVDAIPVGWIVGDVITTRSQTNTQTGGALGGAYFYDIDLSHADNTVIPSTATAILVKLEFYETGTGYMFIHPYSAFASGSNQRVFPNSGPMLLVPITSNRFTVAVNASGAGSAIPIIRIVGYLS